MKGPAIDQLVYSFMFPKPKATDPPNFQAFLQRQLVPEVRFETQAFYGHLSSQEAKYPGLDYSYQPHRTRLSRYPWHRRLFRAFDNLELTHYEIASLTKWEGTRWAKERYEREQGIVIQDTTSDGITNWIEPELRDISEARDRQILDEIDCLHQDDQSIEHEQEEEEDEEEVEADADAEIEIQMNEDIYEESDGDIQSVGVALNERLRAAVAQREAGNRTTVLDEEWEQWFKDAVEAGSLPFLASNFRRNSDNSGAQPSTDSQSSTITSERLTAARIEQWRRVPEILRGIVRRDIEAELANSNANANSNSNVNDGPRAWNYSNHTQQSLSSPSISNSSSRDTTINPHTSRSNVIPSQRRPNENSAGLSSRMRQWESQRTGRTPSGARLAHVSSFRAAQNPSGSGVS